MFAYVYNSVELLQASEEFADPYGGYKAHFTTSGDVCRLASNIPNGPKNVTLKSGPKSIPLYFIFY